MSKNFLYINHFRIFAQKMKEIFIQIPSCLRSSSSGILSETIYESYKEKIMSTNSNFRKWREETKNENNTQINVRNLFKIFYIL